MAIMDLFTSLQTIVNERLAKDVRQAIHDGVYRANQVADENKDLVDRLAIRQDAVEQYNNQVIQEMTDKDVISAPEIIQARGGEQTLQHRLNLDKQEINNHIDTGLSTKADSATVVVVKKVSELTMPELIDLAADELVYLSLDVDVDLVVDTTPIFFTNTKLRTANGSKLIVKNEQYVTFSDLTNYKSVNFISENKTRAPLDIRRLDTPMVLQKKAEIVVKEFSYTGDTDYNADFANIYGASNGLIGISMTDIWGMNANNVFNFIFENADDWITSNNFSNIFFGAFRRYVNYRADTPSFNIGTMFCGNLFENLQGQASSLFIELANDNGLNRYINPFMWDIAVHNRQVSVNKMGTIMGTVRNSYFSNTVEIPPVIVQNNNQYYRLGTFNNAQVAELYLRIKVFAPLHGMKTTVDVKQQTDGTFVFESNSSENRESMHFYLSDATNGGKILWLRYRHAGWAQVSIHERIAFTIDPDGLIPFTESEVSGIVSTAYLPSYKSLVM